MQLISEATAILLGAALLAPAAARADDPAAPSGVWNFIIENDSIQSSSDRHYTHGTRLSYLCPKSDNEAAPCGWAGALAKGFMAHPLLDFELGQSLFTPTNIHAADPDRRDRPYGAWLYVGATLIDEKAGSGLDRLGLQLGIVGPDAQGEPIQNNWHQFIGARTAVGWGHQIADEPGLVLSGERKWRLQVALGDGFAADFIPEAGLTLGNVFTYGAVGGMARFGRNIGFDYGPARIEPALSGTDYFNPDYVEAGAPVGWYLFIGNEDRLVGRNIFLDGNTFRSSRHVPRNLFVADLETGAALVYSNWLRLAYTFTARTDEFRRQSLGPDQFSAVTFSARF
jgi:lipid A 3-O-deacylase